MFEFVKRILDRSEERQDKNQTAEEEKYNPIEELGKAVSPDQIPPLEDIKEAVQRSDPPWLAASVAYTGLGERIKEDLKRVRGDVDKLQKLPQLLRWLETADKIMKQVGIWPPEDPVDHLDGYFSESVRKLMESFDAMYNEIKKQLNGDDNRDKVSTSIDEFLQVLTDCKEKTDDELHHGILDPHLVVRKPVDLSEHNLPPPPEESK